MFLLGLLREQVWFSGYDSYARLQRGLVRQNTVLPAYDAEARARPRGKPEKGEKTDPSKASCIQMQNLRLMSCPKQGLIP